MQKTNLPWNSRQVGSMYENGCLVFDNAIQRGFVWDKRRSSLLVDTMLREMIVPPIFVVKTDRTVPSKKHGTASVYDVIDGKQRCLTVYKYRNNEFALTGIEEEIELPSGESVDVNGMKFDDLPEDLKDVFDRFSFSVCMIIDATPEEIIEVMARLNNGKSLSVVENTRIKAKDLPGIKQFANLDFFRNNMSEKAINGYQNEDVIVKMCMLLDNMRTDEVGLDSRDVKPVYATLDITNDKKRQEELEEIITMMSDIVNAMIEHKKKSVAKRFVNKTNLLSSVKTIKRGINEGLNKDPDHFAAFFEMFFEKSPSGNDDYNAACKDGTNHASSVGRREQAIHAEYEWWRGRAPEEDINETADDEQSA